MRDIPGLRPLLDRASLQANEQPRYRFHGRRSPADRERTPILNNAPSGVVVDGVATLRLYEPIDSWGGVWGISAVEFAEALDQVADATEIQLHINSPGGEVWEALAILNNLRQHPANVVATVDGIAASAASFIATAADETIMAPNSQLMIHDAWGISIGNAADMHAYGDLLDQVSDNIASIYAAKSESPVEEWRAVMRREAWYVADEAVEAGLADKVAGEDPEEDPANDFDLKGVGMKYNGRGEAPPPPKRPATKASAGAPTPDDRAKRFRARRHAENARKITAV